MYHVDTFALCGGAGSNEAFFKADLADEISLVIGPAIDGNRYALTFIGTEEMDMSKIVMDYYIL